MDEPTIDQQIEFLIRRKFPLYRAAQGLTNARKSPQQRRLENALTPDSRSVRNHAACGLLVSTEDQLKKASVLETELRAKTSDEINEAYRAEKTRAQEEQEEAQKKAKAKADLEESQRFFNQSHAAADFDHCSKQAYWKLDEAIALCLGKNPAVANWENVKPYKTNSAFAIKYERIRDLAMRAKAIEQLTDPVLPAVFLAWARRMEIEIPAELVRKVEALGVVMSDWKGAFDTLKQAHTTLKETHETVSKERDQLLALCENLKTQRDEWIAKAKELESAQGKQPPLEEPLPPRSRKSAQKLIIGMAMEWFGYKPDAMRSEAVPDIQAAIEKAGLTLHEDTIRDWLRDSAKLLTTKPRKT